MKQKGQPKIAVGPPVNHTGGEGGMLDFVS